MLEGRGGSLRIVERRIRFLRARRGGFPPTLRSHVPVKERTSSDILGRPARDAELSGGGEVLRNTAGTANGNLAALEHRPDNRTASGPPGVHLRELTGRREPALIAKHADRALDGGRSAERTGAANGCRAQLAPDRVICRGGRRTDEPARTGHTAPRRGLGAAPDERLTGREGEQGFRRDELTDRLPDPPGGIITGHSFGELLGRLVGDVLGLDAARQPLTALTGRLWEIRGLTGARRGAYPGHPERGFGDR
ncbi:MAG: hypothetical protein ACODAA_03595, partial [Gemmatimonadota bacterium]